MILPFFDLGLFLFAMGQRNKGIRHDIYTGSYVHTFK